MADPRPRLTGAQTDAELLFDCYLGLLVLKTMLKTARLGGVDVTEQILADIDAAHPEFPARSALRLKPRRALKDADNESYHRDNEG